MVHNELLQQPKKMCRGGSGTMGGSGTPYNTVVKSDI